MNSSFPQPSIWQSPNTAQKADPPLKADPTGIAASEDEKNQHQPAPKTLTIDTVAGVRIGQRSAQTTETVIDHIAEEEKPEPIVTIDKTAAVSTISAVTPRSKTHSFLRQLVFTTFVSFIAASVGYNVGKLPADAEINLIDWLPDWLSADLQQLIAPEQHQGAEAPVVIAESEASTPQDQTPPPDTEPLKQDQAEPQPSNTVVNTSGAKDKASIRAEKQTLPLITASSSTPAVSSATTAAPPDRPASTQASTTAPKGSLDLRFATESWVKTITIEGKTQERTFKADSNTRIDIATLKQLTIGNASKVRASVNGQPVDLSAYTKGGVLRINQDTLSDLIRD